LLALLVPLSLMSSGCDFPSDLSCFQPGVVTHFRGSLAWITSSAPLPIDTAGTGTGDCGGTAASAEVLLPDYYPFPSGEVGDCGWPFALELQPSFPADCTVLGQPSDVLRDRGKGADNGLIEVEAAAEAGHACTLSLPSGTLTMTSMVGTISLRPATLELVVAGPLVGTPDPAPGGCTPGYGRLTFSGNRGQIDPPH
jgi:hypothetical protein